MYIVYLGSRLSVRCTYTLNTRHFCLSIKTQDPGCVHIVLLLPGTVYMSIMVAGSSQADEYIRRLLCYKSMPLTLFKHTVCCIAQCFCSFRYCMIIMKIIFKNFVS